MRRSIFWLVVVAIVCVGVPIVSLLFSTKWLQQLRARRWVRSIAGLPICPILSAILVVLIGILVSRFAASIGRETARLDAYLSTSTLPYVTLEGSTDTTGSGCTFDGGDYRLLLRSNGQVFVIVPIDASPNARAANIRICSFPESRIQALRIQVGLPER